MTVMKVTILKNNLNEAIQHVSKAITSRTTIPILSGIKIDVRNDGLHLTASDTDISIQCYIPAEQNDKQIISDVEEGSIVLPAKIFVELIRKMPEQTIEIEVNDESFHTIIRSGLTELQMMGLDPEEYPLLPQLDETRSLTVASPILKALIRETSFAVSTNESTPVLTGIQWQFNEHQVKCVATDRHRLATKHAAIQLPPDSPFDSIVIAGKTLNELNKIIPEDDIDIQIVVANNQVLFKINTILFYSRLLDGVYPDTSKIIPQQYKTELIINKKLLLDAIDRAYVLSREENTNIVNLRTMDNETIEISSSLSEYGQIKDEIATDKMDGEPLKISFNSKYMLDALKTVDSELIFIGFTGAMSPIIIKPEGDESMLHLILPYRTTQ